MNKRLQQFLSAENISQSQFAEIIGVAKASVSHIVAGRNKPGFDFIESMAAHFPKLNLEWLINGKGRMYKDGDENASIPRDSGQISDPQKAIAPADSSEFIENQDAAPKITKVVIFYDNGTFKEFQ